MQLRNIYDKKILKKAPSGGGFQAYYPFFYRYVILENIEAFRDELYLRFHELNVFGRIYLAHEGVNAQISVPEENFNGFRKLIDSIPQFSNVPFKIAVEDDGKSFHKLIRKDQKKNW
jgi:UPF0176 protein